MVQKVYRILEGTFFLFETIGGTKTRLLKNAYKKHTKNIQKTKYVICLYVFCMFFVCFLYVFFCMFFVPFLYVFWQNYFLYVFRERKVP